MTDADSSKEIDPASLVQVLPQTLTVLGVRGLTDGLGKVPALLRWEPQLTPIVARYLKLLVEDEGDAVLTAINKCIQSVTLTRWQRLWLLHVMEDVHSSLYPWRDDYSSLTEWMHSEVIQTFEPLRCQAAWALARNRELLLGEWTALGEMSTGYSAPYATACLPGVAGISDSARTKLSPLGLIEKAVAAWSISTHFAPPF